MKLRQRLYDSNNSVDNFDKINCDSLLSNNLDKIKNRKPIYSNRSQLMIRKKSNASTRLMSLWAQATAAA